MACKSGCRTNGSERSDLSLVLGAGPRPEIQCFGIFTNPTPWPKQQKKDHKTRERSRASGRGPGAPNLDFYRAKLCPFFDFNFKDNIHSTMLSHVMHLDPCRRGGACGCGSALTGGAGRGRISGAGPHPPRPHPSAGRAASAERGRISGAAPAGRPPTVILRQWQWLSHGHDKHGGKALLSLLIIVWAHNDCPCSNLILGCNGLTCLSWQ